MVQENERQRQEHKQEDKPKHLQAQQLEAAGEYSVFDGDRGLYWNATTKQGITKDKWIVSNQTDVDINMHTAACP